MATDEKKEPVEREPDCVLVDGTKVYFDKRNITPEQWKSLFDQNQSDEEGDRIITKFACLDWDYWKTLSVHDRQKVYYYSHIAIRTPYDPNLDGASMRQS